MRSQGSELELERRRQLAVVRVNEGYSQQDVAAFLGVHRGTVSRWVCTALERGTNALQAKPTPGRPRKLSARQEKTVLGWMAKLPTSFGFPTDLWTSRRMASPICQRLGIHLNANYLVAWLRSREHTPQKPDQPARERNEAAIARWRDEDWPRLQKSTRRKSSPCPDRRERLFPEPLGAAHLGTTRPDARAGFLGTAPRQGVGHGRLSVAPTLRRLGLYWLADPKNYVTAEKVVRFLRGLLEHLRGKVIVVWDGGSSHKGPLIRAFCARHPRLHLERLPAYAPDHNPVEFVWSHLKHARLPNFVPVSLAHLD